MSLPIYDKTKRKKTFEQLPKDAYVIKILSAKETQNKNGNGRHIAFAFDIAEGEYRGFYMARFETDTNEDKKWPNDAVYRLTVPDDGAQQFVVDNWNTFFADLEDSNNGYVFDGDCAKLKNKILGGKFHVEQTEYNGKIYNHTRLRWTCVADDVRNGRALKSMPNDKLLAISGRDMAITGDEEFMHVTPGTGEEIPFD